MPELPEIETIRRSLAPRLIGRRILAVSVGERRLRVPVDVRALKRWITGAQVTEVARRGKFLRIVCDGGAALILHLGMSGRLLVTDPARLLARHDHLRFLFDDGFELRFCDPRRFGLVEVVPPGKRSRHARLEELGPEPFGEEFSAAYLRERARGSRRPIKNFLMDADVVVGVGNIYASEALHGARLHPARPAGRLSAASWQRLHAAVVGTLAGAIRQGGTTLNDFFDSDGSPGRFQISLSVYGRAGDPCRGCNTAIRRIVQAGRSTFYCPRCQR